MQRWLLPILAVLALLGNATTSWASAGRVSKMTCCCPIPAKCKCDDKQPSEQSKLKRCVSESKVIAPVVVAATITPAPTPAVSAVRVVTVDFPPLPAPRLGPAQPPEKPPF